MLPGLARSRGPGLSVCAHDYVRVSRTARPPRAGVTVDELFSSPDKNNIVRRACSFACLNAWWQAQPCAFFLRCYCMMARGDAPPPQHDYLNAVRGRFVTYASPALRTIVCFDRAARFVLPSHHGAPVIKRVSLMFFAQSRAVLQRRLQTRTNEMEGGACGAAQGHARAHTQVHERTPQTFGSAGFIRGSSS